MPEGSPLEVLRQLHLRSAGELPLYEPTNGSHSNFTWDDLARRTSVPNLKALVADAWLDYPDELTFEDEQVGIRYEEDGTIVLTLTYEQAGALLPGFREETLPRAWSGRPITFAVDNGEGGTPLTCPIDELDQLRGLFASE